MTYDTRPERIVTANMSLHDYYFRLLEQTEAAKRKLDARATLSALKEAKHHLSQLGLELDIKRSDLDAHRVGSDSTGVSVWLTLKDMWNRGAALTEDVIRMSVFDACRFEPQSIRRQQGDTWSVQAEWGG